MTRKISHSVFAIALALGMLAAVSNPSHAALSTADRTEAAAVPAPAPVTLAVAAPTATVATPVAAAATPVAAVAPVAPHRTIAHKAQPQRFASNLRFGYPCR